MKVNVQGCFRDSIYLRYGHEPEKLQGFSDGCGFTFSKNHVLDCKGGIVFQDTMSPQI